MDTHNVGVRRRPNTPTEAALQDDTAAKEAVATVERAMESCGANAHWDVIAPRPATGVGDFFAGAAAVLRETDYADACPIATVALEVASSSEPLRKATADVFESWIMGATERLVEAGIGESKARKLAISIIASMEGAFVLSRAMRSTEPVDVAGAAATAAVRGALPQSP